MLEKPNFEQNHYSKTSTGIYKIAHDIIRLMNGYVIMIDLIMKI